MPVIVDNDLVFTAEMLHIHPELAILMVVTTVKLNAVYNKRFYCF